MPIPAEHELYSDTNISTIDFSVETEQIKISGNINYKIGWNNNGKEMESISKKEYGAFKKNQQYLNEKRTTIKKWYDEHLLDPMDPDQNSLINEMTKDTINDEIKNISEIAINENYNHEKNIKKLFRFNEDLTRFCSKDELHNNKRLNLLNARFKNDLKFKHLKLIPAAEREIQENDNSKIIANLNWMDPIDVQRHNGKKYLLNVYRIITSHCEYLNEHLDSHNLLLDADNPPTFR